MATKFITPSWRMPKNSNQSKASNYSIDFDGSSYISLPSSLDLGTNSTISLWFKSDSGNANHTIIGEDSYQFDYLLQIASASDEAAIRIGSVYKIFTVTEINDGNWNHWCIVRNGDSVELFINNSSKGTQTGYGTGTNTKFEKIGAEGDNQFPITGKIAQLSAFDYALTTESVSALYNNGIPANPLAVTKPPIAYYNLGQGSAYASGSAGIVEPNLAAATGSTVFDFDDNTVVPAQVIETSFNPDGYTKLTFSIWAYAETYYNRGTLFTTFEDTANKYSDSNFRISPSRNRFNVSINGDFICALNIGSAFQSITPNGVWNSITLVYDGTFTDADIAIQNAGRLKFYTNGVYKAFDTFTNDVPSSIISNSLGSRIGAANPTLSNGSSRSAFLGKLSNLQIWNESLTLSEVIDVYNNGTPLQSNIPQSGSLKAWYKLGLDTSNWDGTDWVIGEAQANYTSALDFDGLNDYIDCGTISSFDDGDISFSLWCKLTTTGTYQYILSSTNTSSVAGINIAVHPTTKNLFFERSQDVANTQNSTGYSVPGFDFGSWHHLCGTYSATSGELKAYVNGILKSTTTDIADTRSASTALKIGGLSANSLYPSNGKISNVSIYSSELSAAQVTTLYNSGTPETAISFSPVSWWKLDNLTTGIQDSAGSNNGTNNGATITNIQVSTLNGISSGMDTTNLVPSNLIKSIPYSSYSMVFDAAGTDRINFGNPSNLQITSSLSISVWIKQTTQQDAVVISKDAFSTNRCWTLWSNNYQSNNFVSFTIFDSSNTSFNILSDIRVDDGNWHHLTAVYDASNSLKIYIDGVLNNTNSTSIPSSIANKTVDIIIGESNTSGYYEFPGNISNAAIFNSAITEDQVLSIYNGGVPNDISSLSPVSWWSLAGDSYYDGTNWICPDLGNGGNNGTSANLAATALIGDGPGSTANGTSTNLDLASDLIGEAPGSTGNAISINMNSLARTGSTP